MPVKSNVFQKLVRNSVAVLLLTLQVVLVLGLVGAGRVLDSHKEHLRGALFAALAGTAIHIGQFVHIWRNDIDSSKALRFTEKWYGAIGMAVLAIVTGIVALFWEEMRVNLVSTSIVSWISLVFLLPQIIAAHRLAEAEADLLPLRQLGISRLFRRSERNDEWVQWLENASSLTFFGKDHSTLLENRFDRLKEILNRPHTNVTFYLLAETDAYYQTNSKELEKRRAAAKALAKLQFEIGDLGKRHLHLFQFNTAPTIAFSQFDKRIIFGQYLPGVQNEEIPEFVVEPPPPNGHRWLYDGCLQAFAAATQNIAPLVLPVIAQGAPATSNAPPPTVSP